MGTLLGRISIFIRIRMALQHTECISFYLQCELSKSRFHPPFPCQQIIRICCNNINLQIILVCLKEKIRLKETTPLSLTQLNLLANFIAMLKLLHHNTKSTS
uniref:Uncharacterized protein n=1 Tax=Opuntia streptacantha TaxID=393608 RepID=A0A7C9AQV5_OPUST